MSSLDPNKFASAIVRIVERPLILAALQGAKIPTTDDLVADVETYVRATGVKSQGATSMIVINMTVGKIKADQLTALLAAGYPTSKVGERHGPHYLSLARTGHLPGVTKAASNIPHDSKASKKPATTPVVAPVVKPAETPVVEPVVEKEPCSEPKPLEVEETAGASEAEASGATEAVVPTLLDDTERLRAELALLSQKDLAARAKAVGVKANGKAADIITRIITAS